MVRPLPIHSHSVSLLPQPPLPQMSGHGARTLAGRSPRRTAAHRVLPRGLHPTRADRLPGLLQQRSRLRDPLPRHRPNSARPPRRTVWVLELGFFCVLHSWGQNLHFHPHLHCVVPGGGLSPDHERWIAARRRFLLPVKVLSRLFRRLVLEALEKAHTAGALQFFGDLERLRDPSAFAQFLAPLEAEGMGGLCQASLRRTRSRAGISRPLYPPRRHQQPASAGAR